MKLKIFYKNNKISIVTIMPIKETNRYHYINLTKQHICPCEFLSIEDALKDLDNYKNILKVERIDDE
jgi:hypothetical protein